MPQNDPFAQYAVGNKPVDVSVTKEEKDPFKEYVSPTSEKSMWDYLTTSILPDLPEERLISREGTHPHTQTARIAEEIGREGYNQIVKPIGSVLGAAITLAGGPIVRGVLGAGSRLLPGLASKVGSLAGREVFAGEAPTFIKKAVQELTPKSKLTTTPKPTVPEEVIEQIVPPKVDTPVDKLRVALEESKPLSREQAKLLTEERAAKFKEARTIPVESAEDANKFMSKFKGEHTKLVREPLQLDQSDTDSLFKMIGDNMAERRISTTESAQSFVALRKLLEGASLQQNEIDMLSRTFSPEVMAAAQTTTLRDMILKGVSIPKAIVSAIDFGIPFRQGFNRVGQKEWFGSLWPMMRAYASEGGNKQMIDAIKSTRNYDFFRSNGLALYDDIKMVGDEKTLSSWVQNLPGIRHSNRAFNTGITKMRIDLANTMYDDYLKLYQSDIAATKNVTNKAVRDELLRSAELHNPENEFLARKIADIVNTSTGKGSIGRLEPVAKELNAVLFSPTLISSRLKSIHRVLNPTSYINKDPIERKDALKQLLSMAGTIITTTAALKAAGAEVSLDPRSSDFLKGKIGRTRFDLSGGYPQYFVAPAKIISGESVSAKTGKTTTLNENKFGYDKFDVATQFAINKEAPIASLVTSWLRGVEPTGKETNFSSKDPFENTAMKMAIPIMIQDFKELAEEDPKLLGLMPLSSLGGSVAVHDEDKKSSSKRRSRRRR